MSDLIMTRDEQQSVWDFSCKLAKSKMIPVIFIGKVEDVFVTILYGRELGLSPVMALNSIVVIQGQVTLKVQTMNAIVRSKAKDAVIEIKQDDKNKTVTVIAKRSKDDIPYEAFWDMEKAKLLGLATKHNWVAQPMNMLRARALSEALRVVWPDLLLGLYGAEEMEDLPPIIAPQQLTSQIDEDFPRKPEDMVVGDNYLVNNGTFRSKRLGEIPVEEIGDYRETLIKRKLKKPWEEDLLNVLTEYLSMLDPKTF